MWAKSCWWGPSKGRRGRGGDRGMESQGKPLLISQYEPDKRGSINAAVAVSGNEFTLKISKFLRVYECRHSLKGGVDAKTGSSGTRSAVKASAQPRAADFQVSSPKFNFTIPHPLPHLTISLATPLATSRSSPLQAIMYCIRSPTCNCFNCVNGRGGLWCYSIPAGPPSNNWSQPGPQFNPQFNPQFSYWPHHGPRYTIPQFAPSGTSTAAAASQSQSWPHPNSISEPAQPPPPITREDRLPENCGKNNNQEDKSDTSIQQQEVQHRNHSRRSTGFVHEGSVSDDATDPTPVGRSSHTNATTSSSSMGRLLKSHNIRANRLNLFSYLGEMVGFCCAQQTGIRHVIVEVLLILYLANRRSSLVLIYIGKLSLSVQLVPVQLNLSCPCTAETYEPTNSNRNAAYSQQL